MNGAEELAAATRLADQIRALTQRIVSTDVDAVALDRAAGLVASATAELGGKGRAHSEPSRLDAEMPSGLRAHGLLVGVAHPMAPPVVLSWEGDVAIGRLRFSRAYEGPRGFVHGGISALLLDEVTAKVRPLMRTGRVTRTLNLRYRRPVPVETDLVVRAELVSREGRDAVATGYIASVTEPEVPLVVAETHFVVLGRGDTSAALGRLTL